MQQQEIEHLLEKYIKGQASIEEEAILQQWYSSFNHGETIIPLEFEGEKEQIQRRIQDKLAAHIKAENIARFEQAQTITSFGWYKWAAAASIILAVAVGSIYYFQTLKSNTENKTPQVVQVEKMSNIKPGSTKAMLTLGDGSTIVLDSEDAGTIASQGNTTIIKNHDGSLLYDAEKTGDKKIHYNTITTPRGGQYHITLPDGTKVWLNAESSLTFPAIFIEDERRVQLKGEAYFEVTKNATQPFKVETNQTEIEVLGTHFNVMAYAEDGHIKTTLLEGSVKLIEEGKSATLRPGQQGIFNEKQALFSIKTVNVNEAIAWKNGYYFFNKTDVQTVMRQIERWYDVEVEYQGAIPKDEIVGRIPRSSDIKEVLHIMEQIGLRFKVTGRKIIVLNN